MLWFVGLLGVFFGSAAMPDADAKRDPQPK
jgi:hypothetical protein